MLLHYGSFVLFGLGLACLTLGFRAQLLSYFEDRIKPLVDRINGSGGDGLQLGSTAAAAVFAVSFFLGFPTLLTFGLTISSFVAVPILLAKHRREMFRKNFDAALVDALTTVSASLKAGLPLIEALENTAKNSDPAFAIIAADIVKHYRFGVPIETVLHKAREKVRTQSANISFGAMIIASELGGNLPDILRRIVTTVRDRQRVEGKLQSLTAQGRTQAMLLSAAPPAFGFLMYLWDPQRTKLLIETGTGQILLSIAVVLEIVGIAITKKIMKLDV